MKLYFLRHGKADWPEWTRPDDERPLTKKGREETKRIAKFLCKRGAAPEFILSSPLPRALQTAEAAAKHFCVKVRQEPALAHGFNLAALRALLRRTEARDIMLVGHEPSFSAVIEGLTGGRVKMAKSAVACVRLDSPQSGGTLLWLMPPEIARRPKC